MDFFEAQEFFKKLYPDTLVTFEFDDSCIRQIEQVFTEGQKHIVGHVEFNKVKVIPQGLDPVYVPIKPHRAGICCADIHEKISKAPVYVHPDEKKNLEELKLSSKDEYDNKIEHLAKLSGIDKDAILKHIER